MGTRLAGTKEGFDSPMRYHFFHTGFLLRSASISAVNHCQGRARHFVRAVERDVTNGDPAMLAREFV